MAASRLGLNASNLQNLTLKDFEKSAPCPFLKAELDQQKKQDDVKYGQDLATPDCICPGCSDFYRSLFVCKDTAHHLHRPELILLILG